MDLVARAPRIPEPGETIIGHEFHTLPGGKGANQAVAAARLGGQVAMVGRVGSDSFGKTLRQTMNAAGVDHSWVLQDDQARTGVALIVVDSAGQNSIVVAPGANAQLTAEDVRAAASVITGADVLLLQLETPLETVELAASIAHAHGVTVVLNPAPAQPLSEKLLQQIDVLVPNESETTLLTGQSIQRPQDAEDAASTLLDLGVGTVVLTLGARGAMLAQPGGSDRLQAFDVTPIDTTAAGDAFLGGFSVALGEGQTLTEAVRWGNAAGALATTRLGAQPSLPTREALEHLLQSTS
jgi:ribokinase